MARLTVLVLSLLVLCACVAIATREEEDPELKTCEHQCEQQREYSKEEKERCKQDCREYIERKREGEGGEEEDVWSVTFGHHEPEKKLGDCEKQCDRQEGSGQQRALCRLKCRQKYEREHGAGGEEAEEEEEEENPYVFRGEHFSSRIKTPHGRVELLRRFIKRSKLLQGIDNYRVGFLELNPETFVTPHHFDADMVVFVADGRGTIAIIREGKRESFNIEYGDVVRVPAGALSYLVNRDQSKQLFLVGLFRPVNVPGKFEEFYDGGGEEPESVFKTFSPELLEAAFKIDRQRIEKILRQREGVVMKASREQVEAMSQHEQGGGLWPFGGGRISPINLFRERPVQSNKYGQLWDANPDEFKQIQDLDLAVSFVNFSRGSMAGPFFNSKATTIAFVVDGEGYLEMACPHLKKRGSQYQKISSELQRGMVFIVPPGHPVIGVASENSHLKVVCFKVNADGNIRNLLAGRNNVVNAMEREAKELAFGVPARQVEQVFRNQNEEFFFPGPPRQQHRRGRAAFM